MMRIRKRGETWEVRDRCSYGYIWHACENLEEVQKIIIHIVTKMDHYVKLALEVINGQSDTYLYQDGELIRKKPLGYVFCLTPFLQQRSNLETIIYLIKSGIWRVREWRTPAGFAHFPEFILLPKKKVKKSYLILETTDDEFMPSDFEFIDIDKIQ